MGLNTIVRAIGLQINRKDESYVEFFDLGSIFNMHVFKFEVPSDALFNCFHDLFKFHITFRLEILLQVEILAFIDLRISCYAKTFLFKICIFKSFNYFCLVMLQHIGTLERQLKTESKYGINELGPMVVFVPSRPRMGQCFPLTDGFM